MAQEGERKFGILRAILWPIHRSEWKRVVSLLVLLFFLCVSYNILRNLKDTIVLTAKHSGAEVIPFLKVWGMLPGAILGTWIYTRLSRCFSRETVFYIVISGFISYFLLFGFVVHPRSEQLHLNALGDWLSLHLPSGFNGIIAMVRNWTFTTFYIISELWAVLVLAVLYWGFVNDMTEVSQAKRTYGILNVGSNIAPVLGGWIGILCGTVFSSFSGQAGSWDQTLKTSVSMVAVLGLISMALFYGINRKSVGKVDQKLAEPQERQRLSIRQSIRYICKSRYLTYLAIIVLGYSVAINVTDVLWKEQLKRFFTDPNQMLVHMNMITIGTGIIATLGGISFSLLVSRLGWTFSAIVPPIVMMLMAVGFFTFLFCADSLQSFALTFFGVTPLALTVYFGSLQNCLSKAFKYSLFDASKEMAFLPLDPDSKLKGKAAIDGLGMGIGKSGSSIAYQGLIIFCGSIAAATPYICGLLFFVLFAWISSVVNLGGLFKKESQQQLSAS